MTEPNEYIAITDIMWDNVTVSRTGTDDKWLFRIRVTAKRAHRKLTLSLIATSATVDESAPLPIGIRDAIVALFDSRLEFNDSQDEPTKRRPWDPDSLRYSVQSAANRSIGRLANFDDPVAEHHAALDRINEHVEAIINELTS